MEPPPAALAARAVAQCVGPTGPWRRTVSNKVLGCDWMPGCGSLVGSRGSRVAGPGGRGRGPRAGPPGKTSLRHCVLRWSRGCPNHVGTPQLRVTCARPSSRPELGAESGAACRLVGLRMRGGQGAARAPVIQFTNCRILRGRALLRWARAGAGAALVGSGAGDANLRPALCAGRICGCAGAAFWTRRSCSLRSGAWLTSRGTAGAAS